MDHFKTLLLRFGFQKAKVFWEWKPFKTHAKTHAVNMSTIKIWESTINSHETQFPNLVKSISLILSILGSNSQAERTFRIVTNILSNKRLSMNHNMLKHVQLFWVTTVCGKNMKKKLYKQAENYI